MAFYCWCVCCRFERAFTQSATQQHSPLCATNDARRGLLSTFSRLSRVEDHQLPSLWRKVHKQLVAAAAVRKSNNKPANQVSVAEPQGKLLLERNEANRSSPPAAQEPIPKREFSPFCVPPLLPLCAVSPQHVLACSGFAAI